ncbi:MAG TPA: MarR family transcriptional regulator [Herpetosiphon sp.]|uniref:Transcriptional regulator, MarR family n=1 Tax=Herpetosiphon aurantiacus (strain ATCC 23779 / DSM 785 / 114-95) TaxID=316274 RepID=A9AVF5_HERA2|nr:MarR family winged helix-turn-helix transcriptional regulator [Herpetosiphon sp.]ABX04646.1 transcriptional regulator, MarR family [Herpetosiphon aurantiacus DSM 785]HBW48641.1 MarR family transcriptional regulator [Herpetosiphon sp.]
MEATVLAELRFCACANLRKTARLVTQAYDDALKETGLHCSQFTLLATLAQIGPSGMGQLAEALGMDRTTLTRNLQALQRDGLVEDQPDGDKRRRQVAITTRGVAALEAALPLWQQAQKRVVVVLGSDQFGDLLDTLKTLRRGVR